MDAGAGEESGNVHHTLYIWRCVVHEPEQLLSAEHSAQNQRSLNWNTTPDIADLHTLGGQHESASLPYNYAFPTPPRPPLHSASPSPFSLAT